MSTSGAYMPAAVPECAYAPRMTRAQALALRTAGGLSENCVVVITDGPTIGTAGNTSATEIELNPTGPAELGLIARVHTTFDNSAWPGLYDIDLGTGTITELRDHNGNVVKDVDPGAPTVQTQFPWHLSGANLRDNYVEDSTLSGWNTQVGAITNNRITESTVDLTGKTAGAWTNNQLIGATVAAAVGSFAMTRNRINGGTITKSGTGAFTITGMTMAAATITQNGASAAALNLLDSVYQGAVINLNAGSSNTVQLSNSNTGNVTVTHNGQGGVSVFACHGRPVITTAVGSTRGLTVNSCGGARYSINQNGTGNANADNVNGCMLMDNTLNLNSALAGTASTTISFSGSGQATLNIQDPSTPTAVTQTWIGGLSIVNIQPGGSVSRCRFDADIEFNSGAFSHINCVAEGDFVLSPTAANTNRLLNKSFNDWV